MSAPDSMLELEALIDPARLAAAWRIARERASADEARGAVPRRDAGAREREGSDADAPRLEPAEVESFEAAPSEVAPPETNPQVEPAQVGEPVRAAPGPVALAHRQLLDEIERTVAASPGLAANARRVLSAPLAQLAQGIEPLDLAAAEAALDLLEDILQALLSEAGWPESPDRAED